MELIVFGKVLVFKGKGVKIWYEKLKSANTVKIQKIWTPEKFAKITLKFKQGGFTIREMHLHPKDADRMLNSVDSDQTAPLAAVWCGSTPFAQTCRSENLGTLP